MRKYRDEADCNWVIGSLNEKIMECVNYRGYKLDMPFDPFFYNDYLCDSSFADIHRDIRKDLPDGVEVERWKGTWIFKTKSDFSCKYYETYGTTKMPS